jgi:hypothetical protein
MPNGRCHKHGGATPSGFGLPQTVTGRYSKHLPTRLAARYQSALEDAELLTLRDEVALLDARLTEVLGRVDSGESGRLWEQVQKLWRQSRTGPPEKRLDADAELSDIINQGVSDAMAWAEVRDLIDQRARLVANERQRLVQLQQTITAEQAVALMAAITATIREHVHDRTALAAISAEFARLGAHPGVRVAES